MRIFAVYPYFALHPLSFAFAQQLPQRGRRGRFAPGVCIYFGV